MLGWEFYITRQSDDRDPRGQHVVPPLAVWQAGLGGTKWIDDLVASGVAGDLGGNGYPCRYTVPAGALLAVLEQGLPAHRGPDVFGDSYVLPGGWTGNARIDLERLKALDPAELLLVEAWDQS